MKVGVYVRVSSTEQAEEGYSIQAQTDKIEAYCMARSWGIYKRYIDPGFTGANTNRPALQELINDIKCRAVDVVVVYKLDRFTRSQKDCINLLDDVLLPNNCDFVSISENFDTSTPYGRAMIGILSIFAQLERETIRERTVMGRIERAKGGLYSGNAHLPIGYDYIDGRLVINDYEAMQIREMFDLYIDGASTWKIYQTFQEKSYTTKLGKWSSNAVIRRLLDSRLYHGELKYKGNYYQGKHEPIITRETWERAQNRKRLYHETATGNRKNPFSSHHLLTGLLYCGECNARMHARMLSSHTYSEYICYSFSKKSTKYITNPGCRPTVWQCWELEEKVFEKIRALSYDEIKEMQKKERKNQNTKILLNQIKDIEKRITKLMDLYLMDAMPKVVVEKRSSELNQEKKMLEKQVDELSKSEKLITPKEIMKIVNQFDFVMAKGTTEEKKVILTTLIDKIIVHKDDVSVEWTFN